MKNKNILLRRYLSKRLAEYYAQSVDKVVGSLDSSFIAGTTSPRTIDFSSLLNEWHWKYRYKQEYATQKGMWLTPVELFFPYYSNILANFVSESMTTTLDSFEIVELGGGRGTNANALLNHLSEFHPETYERLQCYYIFDSSQPLHDLQREVLMNRSEHADKVKLMKIDLLDVAEGRKGFLKPSGTPTVAIALETCDNLPHDKILRCSRTGDILQAEAIPAVDREGAISDYLDTSQAFMEIFSPINDPLLQRILSLAPSLYTPLTSHGPRWVPTTALGALMKLFECRPNSSVVLADFDWLPPPDLGTLSAAQHKNQSNRPFAEPALGDPLVTDMDGNDHECYLTSPPNALCDILFPTDFSRLATFTKLAHASVVKPKKTKTTPISVSTMKQRDFLMKFGSDEVNQTKGWSGYSPLIDDFGNCSVLAVSPRSTWISGSRPL